MDEEELLERAEAFAKAHGCTIGERLGFGIHGIVIVLNSESKAAATALNILSWYHHENPALTAGFSW